MAAKLDEILGPFRKQVAESGLSDEGLGALFVDARQSMRGVSRNPTCYNRANGA